MAVNEFCCRFGLETPILNAGMGLGIAGPALAHGVRLAGGLGVLGLGGLPKEVARDQIAAFRRLSEQPFGVNQILPLHQAGAIEACIEASVPLLILFWGDPSPYVADARRAGVALFSQVGDAEEAARAADAGVDGVVVQGCEAGGHVKAVRPLAETLPETVSAVSPRPVIASGGIRTGEDIARALRDGASAVSIGTRYVATVEAGVTEAYKERVVAARSEETALTELFDVGWPNAAHRVLRNRAFREWEADGRRPPGSRPGEDRVVAKLKAGTGTVALPRYTVSPPVSGVEGDLEELPLYCGESCDAIREISRAETVTRKLRAEFEAAWPGGTP